MIQSLKNMSRPMRGLCSRINTSNQITQSYLTLQCKKETDHLLGTAMLQKPSSTERGMPLCNSHLKNQPSTKKGVRPNAMYQVE